MLGIGGGHGQLVDDGVFGISYRPRHNVEKQKLPHEVVPQQQTDRSIQRDQR